MEVTQLDDCIDRQRFSSSSSSPAVPQHRPPPPALAPLAPSVGFIFEYGHGGRQSSAARTTGPHRRRGSGDARRRDPGPLYDLLDSRRYITVAARLSRGARAGLFAAVKPVVAVGRKLLFLHGHNGSATTAPTGSRSGPVQFRLFDG